MKDPLFRAAKLSRIGWRVSRPAAASLWAVLGLSLLAWLFLAPTLSTGYISDDTLTSLRPGFLVLTHKSLTVWVVDAIRTSMQEGRFYPLHWIPYNVVFCLIQNVYYYKVYVVLTIIANLLLFFSFIRRISGDTGFACLAVALALMLMQLRACHDPILSFFGLLQLLVAGVLLSLLALDLYLERRRVAWLGLSVLLYLACLLLYEPSYPLFMLHAVLIFRRRPELKDRLRTAWPFVKVALFCVFMSVLLRWTHPVDNSATTPAPAHYQLNLSPAAILCTLARQTASGLPLNYFLADPSSLFVGVKRPSDFAVWIGRGDVLGVTVVALLVSFASLRRKPWIEGDALLPRFDATLMSLLGATLAVLPAVTVTLTRRYQEEIAYGKPYIHIYVQYFGISLLLATAIRCGLQRVSRGQAMVRCSRLVIAVIVALTTGITYRANCETIDSLLAQPGRPHFNHSAFWMGGAFHDTRLNLQAALRAGLLEDVPEGSRVVRTHEYPYWYDDPSAVFFYAMYTTKTLNVLSTSAAKAALAQPSDDDGTYVVNDQCFGMDAGYVILAPFGRARELRLFLRHPKLFASGPIPPIALLGKELAAPAAAKTAGEAGSGLDFVKEDCAIRLLKSGPDWAIVSVQSDLPHVDPASLRVVLSPAGLGRELGGPITVAWQAGFRAVESDAELWWRWCSKRGALTLNNPTKTPRRVRISMLLQGRSDSPLVFDSASFRAEIRARVKPVCFERELTIAPGSQTISVSTEARPLVGLPHDPRALSFRILNFRVQDQDAATESVPLARKDGAPMRR